VAAQQSGQSGYPQVIVDAAPGLDAF